MYVCAGCGTAGMFYVLILGLFWIPCVYTCTYRTKLRIKYGLPDAPLPDFILHCCCETCALCQEYRELNNRGIDPAIGNLSGNSHFRYLKLYGNLIFVC